MRSPRLLPRRFAGSFNAGVEKTQERARKFLTSSDPSSTQALRRATRRLRTVYSVLPRKVRREPTVRRYFAASREVAKATGRLRDLDTIAAWTSQVADPRDRRLFTSELHRLRASALRKAVLETEGLLDTETPSVEPKRLSRPGIRRRVEKVERRLVKRVDGEFGEFLSTHEVEAMHELRKDSKRLRHLLELSQNGHSPSILERLRSIQDDLGAIRDHDLVIDYLRGKVRLASTRPLVREVIAKRHARLEDFMSKNRGMGRVVPAAAEMPHS